MSAKEIITHPERYYRWSPADRERILAECDQPGAIISEVAKRNDIASSMIHKWRKKRREDLVAGAFPAFVGYGAIEGFAGLPVAVTPVGPSAEVIHPDSGGNYGEPAGAGSLEIHFPTGERMVLGPTVSESMMATVVRMLRER